MILVAAVPGIIAGIVAYFMHQPRRVIVVTAILVTLIALIILYAVMSPVSWRIIPIPVD